VSIDVRLLTAADLAAMAVVHRAAFPGSALSKLGSESVRRYYDWQMNGPHQSVSLGAFSGEALVGFCVVGTFHASLTGFLRRNRAHLICRVALKPWLVLAPEFRDRLALGGSLLLKFRKGVPPAAASGAGAPSFGILSVCTHPAARGQGVARKLMEESERIARDRGFTRMHLTVHASNAPAIRLYERLGWRADPASWGPPDSLTFVKPLGPTAA
jgi:ribosomal protein S18 acetylase RimI-like enzyme